LIDQLDVLAGAVERVGLSTLADAFALEGREGAFSRLLQSLKKIKKGSLNKEKYKKTKKSAISTQGGVVADLLGSVDNPNILSSSTDSTTPHSSSDSDVDDDSDNNDSEDDDEDDDCPQAIESSSKIQPQVSKNHHDGDVDKEKDQGNSNDARGGGWIGDKDKHERDKPSGTSYIIN
jgi:hypothetical protein